MKFNRLIMLVILSGIQTTLSAQDNAMDNLPLNGIKLDPKAQRRIGQAYCQNLKPELQFIESLNELAAANAKSLKVGSVAEYKLTNIRLDKQGKEIERLEYTETWRLKELKGDLAKVDITSDKFNERVEGFKVFSTLYGQKPDASQPMSCLYWRAFAEVKKHLDYELNGTKIPAIYRAQTVFSNVLPEFTYGKGIPFNLLESRETSEFSASKVIKIKKLKSFHF